MSKGIFVLGTDTDVGKTFITAGLTYTLRKNNYHSCSYKCVQSGGILKNNQLISGDVAFIKKVTDIKEDDHAMNPYCLKTEVSPHIAAEIEKVEIKKEKMIEGYKKLQNKYDFVMAEGSGGLVVPIIRDKYYMYDLIKDLQIPVVIVARAGVGTINHTVLTVEYARSKNIDIKGIIINGYTGSFYEDDNIEVIKSITGLDIIAVVHKIEKKNDENFIDKVKKEFDSSMKIENILKIF
ncbi:dethiobiotin synthase [Crassaminicella profunda]|uniref:dethiobiotin synthase n=1 Tax=Crassaminicella profunda TaxID=1286698 RepID=UPI001CA5FAF4|nr:dethiobiotin synthase [Crassaminicella profunda]QZY56933.1 dethiobiotin synthase [Crassaminicella profunda]